MDTSQPNIKPAVPRPKRNATMPPTHYETMALRRLRRRMPRRQPRLPAAMEYRLVALFEE